MRLLQIGTMAQFFVLLAEALTSSRYPCWKNGEGACAKSKLLVSTKMTYMCNSLGVAGPWFFNSSSVCHTCSLPSGIYLYMQS